MILDKEIGDFITTNPSKQKNFLDYQKDKPNVLDLCRAIYYSIRNTVSLSFDSSEQLYSIFIKHSLHFDEGISKEALALLQNLSSLKKFPSRIHVLSSLSKFLANLKTTAIQESLTIINLLTTLINNWKQEVPIEINQNLINELIKLEGSIILVGLMVYDNPLREQSFKLLDLISSLIPNQSFLNSLSKIGFKWNNTFTEITANTDSNFVSLNIGKDFSCYHVFYSNPLKNELYWIRGIGRALKEKQSPVLGKHIFDFVVDKVELLINSIENLKITSPEFNQKNLLLSSYCSILSSTSKINII